MKALIFLITIIISLSSCKKTINGSDISISPVFVGYSDNEIDTFIVNKYSESSNFQNLIDSAVLTSIKENYNKYSNDSVLVNFLTTKVSIFPGFDYRIFIPATNQVFSISEIKNKKNTCRIRTGPFEKREGCGNPNLSYNVNNQTLVAQTLPFSASVVFFRK